MKTLFMTGFSRPSFNPMMGQDFITSYDEGPPSSGSIPNLYTSVDQGPAATTVPGLVTQQDLYKSTSTPSTDWGKILADITKAGATSYAGYTKAQIAEAARKQQAGLPTGLPKVMPPPSSGIPTTALVIGGLAVATILTVIAVS
jgi:hypothetical protein